MFKDNNFTKKYFSIIEKNKNIKPTGYVERHHIIPKSMGGSNNKDNIVYLSAEDHFVCHQLLIEMTEGENHGKMWSALWRMMNKQSKNQERNFIFTKEQYAQARQKHAEIHSKRISGSLNSFYNKNHTAETKDLMSVAKKGKTYEEIFGEEKAKEMRARRSTEQKGKIKGPQSHSTCPHCNTTGGFGIMKRWHFDNCKNRSISYSSDVEIV